MKIPSIFRRIPTLPAAEATIFSNLPEDIIPLILLRLPVKSLLRFRCVSKSWCALISSNQFIDRHFQISERNTNFTNQNIILSNFHRPSAFAPFLKKSWLFNPTYAFHRSFPSIGSSYTAVFLMGCCNGLCCVILMAKKEREYLLWNPSTRKSMKSSKFMILDVADFVPGQYTFFLGFGFDECNHEYKVFEGFRRADGGFYTAYTYSFKNNVKKRIDHIFPNHVGDILDSIGTFVNGKSYWLMRQSDDVNDFGVDIICFDMVTEVYQGVVGRPTYLDYRLLPTIGVLSGCLSLVSGNHEVCKDIWILRKYGVEETWEKFMTIPNSINWNGKLKWFCPVCITPAGELVFSGGNKSLFIYNPKSDWYPRKISSKLDYFCQMNVCVQSLVSPFCCDEPIQKPTFPKQRRRGNKIVFYAVCASVVFGAVHLGRKPQFLNVLTRSICLLKRRVW